MQLILCVEADRKSESDYYYIKSLIDSRYSFLKPAPKLSPLFLGGKNNYCKTSAKIKSLKNKYFSKSIVMMFFDTDCGKQGQNCNSKIKEYCEQNGYFLVWFNRDIEEVFLGHQVARKAKIEEAKRFVKKGQIKNLNWAKLQSQNPFAASKTSNILLVLDSILK